MSDGSFATPISKNDDLNAVGNPLYVQTVNSAEVLTPVCNYKTSILANNATANQDYAVVGTKFRLRSIECASTSNSKFEVQTGPIATLVTRTVIMTGTNNRSEQIRFEPPIEIPAGQIVRVIQKNIQSGMNDVYSSIIGEDVA